MDTILNKLKNDARVPPMLATTILALTVWLVISTFSNIYYAPNTSRDAKLNTYHQHSSTTIAQYHLFGIYDASLNNLPETTLTLSLEGAILNVDDPALSSAIIKAPNVRAKIYHIGDQLPGGATLKRVLKDAIILNNHGDLSQLRIPIETLGQQDI